MRMDRRKSGAGSGGKAPFPCLCAATRRAGRVLTRRYDAHLKPSGLKVTQYSMMANIARNPGLTVSALAKLLVMDQTTVSRNLGVLEKAGYVCTKQETDDQRIRQVHLSDLGRTRLEQARPLWNQAQMEMEEALGREGLANLLEYFRQLIG